MKLLLDESVTRHLKREFANHEVHTVEEAGFKGLENGNLLRAASGVYDVLIKAIETCLINRTSQVSRSQF